MKYDHLIQSMESGAEEKIRDVRDRLAREREGILDKARSDGEHLKQEILADIQKKSAIEMNKQLYHARAEVAIKIATDHEAAFNSIFRDVSEKVSHMRES